MAEQEALFAPEDLYGITQLESLRLRAMKCLACPLASERTHVVFGEGRTENPRLAIVGEAPGKNEDQKGRPFVGQSGRCLGDWLGHLGLSRAEVFLTNTVLCRPPDNRKPAKKELASCASFLVGQLRCVRPDYILLLGGTAAEIMLGKGTLHSKRGRWHSWEGIPTRVTYHPAYILRSPDRERDVLRDLKAVRDHMEGVHESPSG